MNKIDDILKDLQHQQPLIADEEAFVDSIMDSLPDLPEEDIPERISPLLIAIRTFSSIAAVLVVGLFIFLNVDNRASADSLSNEHQNTYRYTNCNSGISRCSTPQEAIKYYTNKKSRNINQLISMYNENY